MVSDVAEALIAASYLSGDRDINSAVAAAQTLKVGLKALSSWSDAVKFASNQPVSSTDTGLGSLLGLSSTTVCGYKFRDSSRATCVLVSEVPPRCRVADSYAPEPIQDSRAECGEHEVQASW